ncbi:hypothetical protein GQ42DRAFT_176243 [Ramicandelaber brevisporus]|nr:hypothetical protein GQ42DRAFT_176243 [Ramicandelaber brevisporus]
MPQFDQSSNSYGEEATTIEAEGMDLSTYRTSISTEVGFLWRKNTCLDLSLSCTLDSYRYRRLEFTGNRTTFKRSERLNHLVGLARYNYYEWSIPKHTTRWKVLLKMAVNKMGGFQLGNQLIWTENTWYWFEGILTVDSNDSYARYHQTLYDIPRSNLSTRHQQSGTLRQPAATVRFENQYQYDNQAYGNYGNYENGPPHATDLLVNGYYTNASNPFQVSRPAYLRHRETRFSSQFDDEMLAMERMSDPAYVERFRGADGKLRIPFPYYKYVPINPSQPQPPPTPPPPPPPPLSRQTFYMQPGAVAGYGYESNDNDDVETTYLTAFGTDYWDNRGRSSRMTNY